ncbi:tyrosine-type recombinase/integrase [Alteribacter aurantiacus]|uniref:tyrosine-type recombinase/integrase n=1 Tax=Alteribacter aurantiacus TaxID=254410 RepID=UPI0003FB9FE5|nr:tyrosine-type recombinase/integrase [Alteribacter aurantiacus]
MTSIHVIEPFLTIQCSEKQESTVKRYRYDLIQFYEWCKDKGIKDQEVFGSDAIHAYYLHLYDTKRYSVLTIKRIMSVLKQHYLFVHPSPKKSTPLDAYLKKETVEHKKSTEDFLQTKHIKKLLVLLPSNVGLTDHQQKYRHYYSHRNQGIIHLMLFYGLTVQEVCGLTMKEVHFPTGIIRLFSRKRKPRTVTLEAFDRRLLHHYYKTIPISVRPRWQTNDPFFVSFDFQRGTYRWDYDNDKPKQLTGVSVQKMIRQEVRRTGIGKGISGRILRNTYILHKLVQGKLPEELKDDLVFATTQPFESFTRFIDESPHLEDINPLTVHERKGLLDAHTFRL